MLKNRLGRLLGAVALCSALAAGSAEASESRIANFSFPCNGANNDVVFTTSGGLGNSVTRLIQGAEIILFENQGGLQYIFMSVAAQPNRTLVGLSFSDNRASNQFTGFFQVMTSPTGAVSFVVSGACNPGFGQIQGTAIISFF